MRSFAALYEIAAARKGGADALERRLAETAPLPRAAIAATPDDRILAAMTQRIFSAGFSWKVIEAKWPGFEAAFFGFEPHACAFLAGEQFEALLHNADIVRNGAKIRSVQVNARFLLDLAAEHGTAARFFADWPDDDLVGLLEVLKARGSHLGGDAAPRTLRAIGKPAWVATPDVVAALIREGVIDRPPTSKRDRTAIQAAFNAWAAESGRDATTIGRTLAMTVESPSPASHGRHA
ncbi:3-methyladenine DNA glycosylase [Siculibacillus lacustris]|uniref:3-methyladenine DNA glycosylase n=1 Tax=Siculibacillus lacustris TaxID=1549641 RepID=A0A4Q9VFQ6_9HYPH|nr:DNA-3-methyladenine glycosylase I [Siculibacillus lacustris]TBW33647.1 3-methyladenine DNA glycosylase [Siculibacillus lacustris]